MEPIGSGHRGILLGCWAPGGATHHARAIIHLCDKTSIFAGIRPEAPLICARPIGTLVLRPPSGPSAWIANVRAINANAAGAGFFSGVQLCTPLRVMDTWTVFDLTVQGNRLPWTVYESIACKALLVYLRATRPPIHPTPAKA